MLRRSLIAVVASAVVLVAVAGAASAHVTANPESLPAGGFAVITFRVPTESSTASTTKLEVTLPADAPFGFVSVKPVPGWTHTEETAKLDKPITTDDGEVTDYTSKITWEGGKIAPGEFQEFDVSVGPVPDVSTLVFKAVQTYDNGDVVRWIEEPTSSGEEPEHPAPTITVTKASDGGDTAAPAASSSDDANDDSDGNGLATAALVVGIIGVLLGGAALVVASRRKSTRSS
jgi:uncharacterized protein YcnI